MTKVCLITGGTSGIGLSTAKAMAGSGYVVYEISKSVAGMEHDEQSGMNPDAAGRFICKVATRKNVKPVYTPTHYKSDSRQFSMLCKHSLGGCLLCIWINVLYFRELR